MNRNLRSEALMKLAFFGPATVSGAPSFAPPPLTVGQTMYNIGANNNLSTWDKRNAVNAIVNSGANVNSPAKNLLKAGIGALAGNLIANTINAGPFWRGVMTAAGANYGYKY